MEERDFTIAGRPYHALAVGREGRPLLLFLHGFPEYSGAWAEVMPHLADEFFCLAPDQRGYGRSWRPRGVEHYAMPHLLADAEAMIARFAPNGQAAAVIGHDWGAAVAYALAIGRPALLRRLVILNGVHPVPFQRALAAGGAQSAASQYIDALRAPGSEARLAVEDFAPLLRILTHDMDLGWMTPERRAAYRAAWRDADGLGAMIDWYRASPLKVADPGRPLAPGAAPAFDAAALRVRVPHLLIWGRGDTALLPESRDGLADLCDDLKLVEIDDADHWINHQKPGRVAAEIAAFLAEAD